MSRLALVLLLNIASLVNDVLSDNTLAKMEIAKCCGENQAIDRENQTLTCVDFAGVYRKLIDLSSGNITVYNKDVHDEPTDKAFGDYFRVSLERIPNVTIFENTYYNLNEFSPTYISEDGTLYLNLPNTYIRWIQVNSSFYCIDYIVENYTEHILSDTYSFWIGYFGEGPPETHVIIAPALMVSVVFLAVVLIVYILLPGLRNLGGKVLMAYVFSLLLAFLLLAIIQQVPINSYNCVVLSTMIYFFFLASFCWMTVMSYDIWWTFGGYDKARLIHRSGETFKFRVYCIFGWGVPLAMSIAFVVINNTDLSHMPWFIKPQIPNMGCFLEGGQKLVYLYAPMLILVLSNWMFFLMTAFNIWRLHRGTAVLDSPAGTAQAHRNLQNRLFIYLKLSVIMGINWILEVMSTLAPEYDFWYIIDAYNILTGFTIFLIFVCKKRIYKDLRARFNQTSVPQPKGLSTTSQTSSTTLSAMSRDLGVIDHPNGTSN